MAGIFRTSGADPRPPRREGIEYRITADDVYVRSHPMGLAVGELQEGDTFTALEVRRGWAYGYADGDVRRAGWILLGPSQGQLHTAQRTSDDPELTRAGLDTAPSDARYTDEVPYVGRGVRLPEPWNLSFPATVTRPEGLRTYANYDPERGPSDQDVVIPEGAEVGIRYIVGDWAMLQVKSTTTPDGKPRWVFGRLSELQAHDPRTVDAVLRRGEPVPDGYRHPDRD